MSCVRVEITGKKFNRLTAVRKTGDKNYKGSYIWEFVCECGKIVYNEAYPVTSGTTKSCGCYAIDNAGKASKVHGWSGTKQYAVWNKIKARILDSANPLFEDYGGRGLKISPEFVDDMEFFYEYMGPKPLDGKRYTVGRIDNDIGYVIGNLRWELYCTQNRNQRKRKSNSSNFTGVVWAHKGSPGSTSAVARWYKDGKQCTKAFSTSKLGLLPAFAMACKYREDIINKLNAAGAGYSDKHGK